MKRLSLAEAKDIAAHRADQRLSYERDSALCSYFDEADAEDLTLMWETGHNLKGGKLTEFEFAALVEAWVKVFGCYPPSKDS